MAGRRGGISGSTSAHSSSLISRGGGEDTDDDIPPSLRRCLMSGQSPRTYFRNVFLRSLLQDHLALGAATYAEAWERWALLCYLERCRARFDRPSAPLLLVDGDEPAYAPAVVLLCQHLSNATPNNGLLAHGNLGGTPESAEQALHDSEVRFAEWVDREDWNALPLGGGAMDTGPRYPTRPRLNDD